MKILMLHGYTQNANTFRRKFAAVRRHLETSLLDVSFYYLDAPCVLDPNDKPGALDRGLNSEDLAHDGIDYHSEEPGVGSRAWFYLNKARDQPHGVHESIDLVAKTLRREGPFDGCIAFSQGTIIAGMVLSLLEGQERRNRFESFQKEVPEAFPYPTSFMDLGHPPLKFAIFYGGLVPRSPSYSWLYSKPRIKTQVCHFTGRWDPVVDADETEILLQTFKTGAQPLVIVHPGAHSVPITQEYCNAAENFIRGQTQSDISARGTGDGKAVCRIAAQVRDAEIKTKTANTLRTGRAPELDIRVSSAPGRRLLLAHEKPAKRRIRKPCISRVDSANELQVTESPEVCPCCRRPFGG